MEVTLIAHTCVRTYTMEEATDDVWETDIDDSGIDLLAEFAGRACYQSWDKPNPKTRSNEDYLANVIGLGHESVLSHASATFYATGVSRSLTHELIRHRFLSFSELSQRYVDAQDFSIVVPPLLDGHEENEWRLSSIQNITVLTYLAIVDSLEAKGLTGKKAREAARAVLPGGIETKIVVSGNIRAWRDFLKQRLSPHADAEIREFAEKVYDHLHMIAPNSMIGIK